MDNNNQSQDMSWTTRDGIEYARVDGYLLRIRFDEQWITNHYILEIFSNGGWVELASKAEGPGAVSSLKKLSKLLVPGTRVSPR